MADREILKAKYDELMAQLATLSDEINIKQTLYHDISVCRDEIARQLDVIDNGEKRIEPLTIEAIQTEMAKKIEPIKEVIEEPIIK